MNEIKKRKAVNSKRGIYLQDRELSSTIFKPGVFYKYVLDVKNNKLIILPSSEAETSTKVCKLSTKKGFKSVIDIRRKEVKDAFKNADYLQITICDEAVYVEGYANSDTKDDNGVIQQTTLSVKKISKGKIVDITDILRVKKTTQIVMSKNDLQQVVGFEQLSLFDFIENTSTDSYSTSSVVRLKESFENLRIPLTVASLFSGAGVLDKGFKDSGFDITFALEIDKDACLTYEKNLGKHMVNADITKFDKSKIPLTTVMIGGSPCQGFSNNNRITNYLDNPKNLLVREYISAIQANNDCKVFVLENVPRILTAGNGQFIKEIINELSEFDVTYDVLSAADFGSAQKRDRAIIIGSKIGKIDLPKPSVLKNAYNTVRKAFQGLTDAIPNQKDCSTSNALTVERMKYIAPGCNATSIPAEIRPKGQHSDFYKRLEWDKPSITISNPRKSVIIHPEEHRILSVRECARLFGLPDDFVFYGSLAAKQQQIANAVSYDLSLAIANVIKSAISKYNLRACTI